MPAEESAALYGLSQPGVSLADRCYVKVYDDVDDSVPDNDEPHRRVGPAHAIYPMEFEPNFHELEYFVPFENGRDAIGRGARVDGGETARVGVSDGSPDASPGTKRSSRIVTVATPQ